MNAISLFRQNDPYEQLIQNMLVIEGQPQERLFEKKDTESRVRNVISDVDSNLSALHTLVKSFTDAISNPFDARSAPTPDGSGFSVSVGKEAAYGSHSIEVLRLASADTRISKQWTSDGTSLRTFFDANGPQSFSIEVAHPTEEDPDNRVAVNVTVDPAGTTDSEVLDEIRSAIRTAMDDAVAAGTIEKDEAAVASVVSETTSTSRLTLKSSQTGYSNRLTFSDSPSGLLSFLEVNSGGLAAGTGGGQIKAVGTDETDSELNSQFVIDGLTLYRDSNSVDDALTGVTISLTEADLGSKDFTVAADETSIKTQIEDFIKKYNAILTHLQAKMTVDADAGIRGDLAGDSTFRSLRYGLRNDVAGEVSGQSAEGPSFLSDLGIDIQDDGTLVLDDVDKLVAAVEKDADAVQSLFAGPDGIATKLRDRIDLFVGSGGILSERIKSIDTSIRRLDDRIGDWDDRLARREDSLRLEFARMQESIAALQGQQQNLGMYFM